ncbi:MAG: Carbohydrate binding domain protein, partial [Candidatus Methanoperedens nitroreducens]
GISSAASTSILVNPGFESGTSPWIFYTNGAGKFLNNAPGIVGTYAGHVTISSPGTNVQLYQKGLVLSPNTKYTLSFKAYSNTGHDLSISLLKHGSPYTKYGLSNYVVNLGTSWSQYSIQFTTTGFSTTVSDGRLMFWLAPYDAASDQYYLDDVVLTKVSVDTQVSPTIVTQPASKTITVGQTAIFSVAATGTAPLTYQWQKNGTNIPGATGASYTTPAITLSDNGARFRVLVSNAWGSVNSNEATLTVSYIPALSIISNPGFELGTSPWVFYTNGAGTLLNNAPGFGSPHAGHITISQQGTNVQLYQKGLVLSPNTKYTLSFKAYSNTGHDLSISLMKHISPYTSYGLSNYVVNLGTSWTEYSVQFTTTGFSTAVRDGRLMFMLAPYDAASDQYYFDDVVLTKVSQATQVPPTIVTQPASKTITVGQTAIFSVAATGTAPLTYQWQKNGTNIPGATGASYTTPSATLSYNGAAYRVIVTNAKGSVTSNQAILTVRASSNTNQLVIIDEYYTHNTITRAFSFFGVSNVPSNLVSPVNYAGGTIYSRLQVITKPSTKIVNYQMCLFQDQLVAAKHACTNYQKFNSTGTYYASQPMTSLYQYNKIVWSRQLLERMLVVKDKYGMPVDNRYRPPFGPFDGENFNLYYPMKVRYTAIIVPPNGGQPVWP